MSTLKSKVLAVMAIAAGALASTALVSHADEPQLDPRVWQAIVADAGLDAALPEAAPATQEQ
jgi:hypothetical protein